jgi:glycosyltransferase involved in cell wall biosynthesis
MYEDRTVAVVVPAYNEIEHVGNVLESIPAFVDRIYVVDDRSSDGTWREVRRRAPPEPAALEAEDPATAVAAAEQAVDGGSAVDERIAAIRHERNQGAGGALRTGYQHAHADGVDLVVAMDADDQMDPAAMPDLLDPLVEGEADYAKGNRLATPAHREQMPAFRLFGNSLLTFLTKVASGYWKTMDPQNGYTAITHEALDAIEIGAIPTGHDYTNDLLVRLNVAEMRVADVPMPAHYGDEESTIDFLGFVPRTSTTLLEAFVWRLRRTYLTRDFHPLALAYGAGAGSVGLGLVSALAALRRRWGGRDGAGSAAVAALLSLLFGTLFLLAAMYLDMSENEDREVRRK